MSGVELIVAALAAGATAGITGIANDTLRDAYAGLRNLLRRRLVGHPAAQAMLDSDETDPERWRTRLGTDLTSSGADGNAEILAAARRVLAAATASTEAAHYQVEIRDSQGIQVGPYGTMTITMGPVSPRDQREE